MYSETGKHKALIFIVSYNAEAHIAKVLQRCEDIVPDLHGMDYEVLLIDDTSKDNTIKAAEEFKTAHPELNLTIFRNPVNQGYGGNQKLGYQYAIKFGFDSVALLHGDNQYPPECIKPMLDKIVNEGADMVLGSRMLNKKEALKGGMPYYKFAGNIVLSSLQNYILDTKLSEFHTGFKAYSTAFLKRIPFSYNSNDFDFDTDIIIQAAFSKAKIAEVPIPTYYGDEICNVNGYKYALQVIRNSFFAKAQKYSIYYHPKYDFAPDERYESKVGFDSSHKFAVDNVNMYSNVLDINPASDYVAEKLKAEKTCNIHKITTTSDEIEIPEGDIDTVLIVDVLENFSEPEKLLVQLRNEFSGKDMRVIVTSANVGFFLMRLSLLLGNFSYGKRGILDSTHKRLFTFYSLKRMFKTTGYSVEKTEGLPIPFPLFMSNKKLANFLLRVNKFMIRISRSLFSFQIAVIARPRPTLDILLDQAEGK